jgi:hypothetical protein
MNPVTYTASIAGNSVIVTPDNPMRRVCRASRPEVLLRQSIATGEVVRMPDRCSGEGWLDECVPKGGFRYGFAMPYACCPTCCRTDFFVEVLIQQDPPANCEATRISDNPKPAAYTGGLPWVSTKEICGFTPPPDAARPPSTGSRPEPTPGNPGPSTPEPTNPGNPSNPGTATGGCSVGGSGTSAVVLTLGGLLAAALFVRTPGRRRRR